MTDMSLTTTRMDMFWLTVICIVSFFLTVMMVNAASAESWPFDQWGNYSIQGTHYGRHTYRARRAPARDYDRDDTRLYRSPRDNFGERGRDDRDAALLRDRERFDGNPAPVCLPYPVDVVGTIHTSKEASMEYATKMWSLKVQFQNGSQYMDWQMSTDQRVNCTQADAMLTVTGRANEVLNQALGRDGQNVACQLVARPCRARMINPAHNDGEPFREGNN
jgi:hypothetical protein